MNIQETYNHFINKSNVENWDWYHTLKNILIYSKNKGSRSTWSLQFLQ